MSRFPNSCSSETVTGVLSPSSSEFCYSELEGFSNCCDELASYSFDNSFDVGSFDSEGGPDSGIDTGLRSSYTADEFSPNSIT